MNTEITENKLNGWVLYDADCRWCKSMARHFRHLLAGRRLELLPLQTPWVKARLGMPDSQLLEEMRLMRPDGKYVGGADAVLEISHYFWWAWPLWQIGRIPVVTHVLRAVYRWIASNRPCANGSCAVTQQSRALDFLPLATLPFLALLSKAYMTPWIFMWAMAFALYGGCKWLTYREAVRHGARPGLRRTLGYLLVWPGMDAVDFLDEKKAPAKPRTMEWAWATTKMCFGVGLVWGVTRTLLPAHPILAGWTGMFGTVFILHFGLFHVLSLAWRRAGICATPVMQNPIAATSLAEFWGKRWNTAFNELAFRFTFRPLRRLTTPALATLLVFGLSGLIHDLLISLPARGGYGLPTLYFLIQGLGVIAERGRFGRRIGLGHGVGGWLFTLLVTVGPVYWLFHPPFITHVILPMLTAIGAT
ncbi:MAG TPA: DCC1-like thiol-disulfide oxidoreductase family protein [Candidatus Acidoferrales bacterium]|nr:DCC1-like thiol-disulfide oxidoreductase family protein [Candidatus Acidoferrales bacterium]